MLHAHQYVPTRSKIKQADIRARGAKKSQANSHNVPTTSIMDYTVYVHVYTFSTHMDWVIVCKLIEVKHTFRYIPIIEQCFIIKPSTRK